MTPGEARAVARLARRTARREWRRTTLVALLVTVPVAVGVVVAGMMRAADVTPAEQATNVYGQARVRVEFWPGEAADARRDQDGPPEAAWPEGAEVVGQLVRQAAGDAEVVRYREVHSGEGRVTDLDLASPVTDGMLRLVDGRAPDTPDEIAASPAVLASHDATVGDTITWWDGTDLAVVGEVIDPLSVNNPVSVVHPDRLEEEVEAAGAWSAWDGRMPRWLVAEVPDVDAFARRVTEGMAAAIPDGVPSPSREPTIGDARGATQAAPVEVGLPPAVEVGTRTQFLATTLRSSSPNRDRVLTPQVIATLVTSVLLAEVALIAGAAYATGARRRLRELGLLGANGATTGHLRAAVVGEATVTGTIGGLVGVVAGVAALHLGRPIVQQFVGPLVTGTELSVTDLVGPAVAAVIAVSLAAWLPARTAARVPTTTALQGRMALAAPRHWITPAGLVLSGIGALLLLVGLLAGGTEGGVVAALGVLAAIGGTAMLTVPIIAALGRVADRLPAMLRLVVRDSGRQRTRAAAAAASAMVVLIAPILVGTISMSDQQQQLVQGLPQPDDHVYVPPNAHTASIRAGVPGEDPEAPSDELRADTLATLREHLPTARETAVTLLDERARLHPAPPFDLVGPDQRAVERHADPDVAFWRADPGQGTHVAVGTPELLDVLHLPAATDAITGGTPVVLGLAHRMTTAEVAGHTVDAVEVPAPVVHNFPRLLLPPDAVDALGLAVVGTADLLVTAEPISAQTARDIHRTVNALDIAVGAAGFRNGPLLRWLAVAATLVVALVILALVTMLSATESDHDVRTMVAVGAAPRMRRRFLGLQGTVHALVGAVLATPLGLALAWAALATQDHSAVGPFGSVDSSSVWLDWSVIAAVVLAVPAAIGVVIAGLVRSAPTVPPRRLG